MGVSYGKFSGQSAAGRGQETTNLLPAAHCPLPSAMKKVLLIIVVVVVAAAAVVVAKIGPRNVIGMIRYDQRRAGDLKVGDRAPDAMLMSLDGKLNVPLMRDRGGKPLVLVFGSFT